MSELKCPFCEEELSYAQEIDGGFEILTCDCPRGIWLFGNDKMWYNLEKAKTELERTRKALDVAVYLLKIMNDGLPNGNRWKWEIEKALDQIKQITEQKDVK